MAEPKYHVPDEAARQIERWIEQRIQEIAAEEMEAARERMRQRIPELAAEIGVRLQSALAVGDMEAYLTVVLRPKLGGMR